MILTQQPFSFPRLYLSAGITSARTAGSIEPYTDIKIKESITSGNLIGPDFDLTAPYLESKPAAAFQLYSLKDADEAREMVRYWAHRGFTSFKAYTHITRAQLAAAIDEAHKHELKMTAHLCSVTYREAVDLGIDQLEHGFAFASDFYPGKNQDECPSGIELKKIMAELAPEDKRVQSLFHHLINNKVVISSTLDVMARGTNIVSELPDEVADLLKAESRTSYEEKRTRMLSRKSAAFERKYVKSLMALEFSFWRAGGTLVVGTDPTYIGGTLPGHGSLSAIELLAKAGIPPLEVIKIATENGAKAMGVHNDRGTIEIGKRADLLVINGDPSSNIKDIYNLEMVFKKGVGYSPFALRKSALGSIGGPG